MAGIRLHDQQAGHSATTSIGVARGSAYAVGDLVIAVVVLRNNGTITPPSGFSFVASDTIGSTFTIAIYSHVVTDIGLTSVTWTVSAVSIGWHVAHAVFRGADTDNPIQASYLDPIQATNNTVPAALVPDNHVNLVLFGSRDIATLTPDTSLVALYNGTGISSRPALWLGLESASLSASLGPYAFSISSAQRMAVGKVTLKPSAATITLDDNVGAIRILAATRLSTIDHELILELAPVSWRLNGMGQSALIFAKDDAQVTDDFVDLGNLVVVEFENGLPMWAGSMEPEVEWRQGRYGGIKLLDGVNLLKLRHVGINSVFTGKSGNEILGNALAEARQPAMVEMKTGALRGSASMHTVEYHYTSLYDVLRDITSKLTDDDFVVDGFVESGKIVFYVTLDKDYGAVSRGVGLIEGLNISQISLVEKGPLINQWVTAGAGDDWTENRANSSARDSGSEHRYGTRASTAILTDYIDQDTLDQATDALLESTKEPVRLWDLQVVNVAPALFRHYHIGDRVRLMAYSVGADSRGLDVMVRVLEREFDPTTGICRLIVEETDDDPAPSINLASAYLPEASMPSSTATPDTLALIATRDLSATVTGATATPDVAALTALRDLSATIAGATATPDTAALVRTISASLSIDFVSVVSDTVDIEITRNLEAAITVATAVSDSAVLSV